MLSDKLSSKINMIASDYRLVDLLKYLESMGNGATKVYFVSHFRVVKETIKLFQHLALCAVLALESTAYFRPSRMERKVISAHIQELWSLSHCPGVIDGTLLPLQSKLIYYSKAYCISQERVSYKHDGKSCCSIVLSDMFCFYVGERRLSNLIYICDACFCSATAAVASAAVCKSQSACEQTNQAQKTCTKRGLKGIPKM